MLADPQLRAHADFLSVATYDWVHSMLADGAFTAEVQAYLAACEPEINRVDLQAWLSDDGWGFPFYRRSKSKQLCRIFDYRRQSDRDPDRLKANCSEMLGLASLLRHYLDLHEPRRANLADKRASWLAICQALDLILAMKRSGDVSAADQLQEILAKHLGLFQKAYGTDPVKPKHHWMLDIPQQFKAHGQVLDCFIIERQHLMVKAIADHVDNTSNFERSVMSGVLTSVFGDLPEHGRDERLGDSLQGRSQLLPGFPSVRVANKVAVFGYVFAIDDIVARDGSLGVIAACLQEGPLLFVAVDTLVPTVRVTARHSAHKLSGDRELWPASAVHPCNGWYRLVDGSLVVIT